MYPSGGQFRLPMRCHCPPQSGYVAEAAVPDVLSCCPHEIADTIAKIITVASLPMLLNLSFVSNDILITHLVISARIDRRTIFPTEITVVAARNAAT